MSSVVTTHGAASILDGLGVFTPKPNAEQLATHKQQLLDAAGAAAASYTSADIRGEAVAMVIAWGSAPSSDLAEGETFTARLNAMLVGVADANKDGDISDDEADVIQIAAQAVADFLVSRGVSDADVLALLEDDSAEAGDRVHELLSDLLPTGDDEQMAEVDAFVFDQESSESVLDSVLDAVYKKKIAIRHGKKVRINKRVSGTVRLSAAQKVAIKKAVMKSRSSIAKVRRLKSMKVRRNMGIK
ncbi:hypothetical protein [Comamonas sp. HJ-2]